MTATFSQGGPYDGILYVYPPGLSTDFLTDLGFTMTTGLEGYAPQPDSQAEISAENVGLIDADVVVFATEDEDMFDQLQDFGTISSLSAVAENRAVYTDGTLAGALYFETPLSLSYTLERLTPMLEAATDGSAPRAYPS
jgi:iron complex transport system substrate-binding protein